MKKIANHTLTGVINCVSGLRVGGSDELLETGGADSTCIKNPVTLQPYIPGSSIKGKLRSEMEFKLGKFGRKYNKKTREDERTEPCDCGQDDCLICRIFGPHNNLECKWGPARLICRDAQPSAGQTIIYEIKTESANNRQTGGAHDPRKIERVPAGTKFDFKLSIQEWDIDKNCNYNGQTAGKAMIEFMKDAMRLVQATGIGSGITRGSGEIKFESLKLDGADFSL